MEKAKFTSTISLDEGKELDLIKYLEHLRDTRRMGDFVSSCVRACWDNQELYKQTLASDSTYGTQLRKGYFDSIENKILDMRNKVDKIYDIAFSVYTLALMGKRLGIEERAENSLKAQFILQKQINDIARALSINTLMFESDRLQDTKHKAEQILEYIINSYDSLLAELKISYTLPLKEETQVEVKEHIEEKEQTSVEDNIDLTFNNNAEWEALSNFLGND